MLVTFRSKAYANITMFGDVAVTLLKLMGHSGTVPSAIKSADIPSALQRLRTAIAKEATASKEPDRAQGGEEREPAVALANRALPLIELLEAAAAQNADVTWSG
jgi:hypothetical protein